MESRFQQCGIHVRQHYVVAMKAHVHAQLDTTLDIICKYTDEEMKMIVHLLLLQWSALTYEVIREPMWCNDSTLTRNARSVGLILALCAIFCHTHFCHTHDTACHNHDPVKAIGNMVVERALCMYM